MKKLFLSLGLTMLLCFGFANTAQAYTTEAAMFYNEGLDQYSRGEYAKAIQSFKSAVEKDPECIDAYYNLGALFEYLKSYQSAIASFTKINQLDPTDTEVVIKLAELYNKAGNPQRALSYLNTIKETDAQFEKAKSLKALIVSAQQQAVTKNALTSSTKVNEATKQIVDKFAGPTGMAVDSQGVLFVASYTENSIYKIMPNGQSYLYSKNPALGGPIGLAIDAADNLYVANYAKNNILKITKTGQVHTFIQNIVNPYYLIIKNNYLYITEQGSNTVVKYKLY